MERTEVTVQVLTEGRQRFLVSLEGKTEAQVSRLIRAIQREVDEVRGEL
jgi:hypothetical protein